MPLYERAAQFAPFAALTGFDEQLGEEARFTDSRPTVCDEDAQIINENLNILLSSRERLCVRLTYFVPDSTKSGGALLKKEGEVRRFEMGETSGRLSDISVITEDNSRFEDVMDIIEDIKTGLAKTDGKYVVVPNRKEAIRYCMLNAQDGDIIVLAGKGHEDYQEIKGVKYHMDERELIADIIKEENLG